MGLNYANASEYVAAPDVEMVEGEGGIEPFSVVGTGHNFNFLTETQIVYLRAILDKIPISKHYILGFADSDLGIMGILFIFDEYVPTYNFQGLMTGITISAKPGNFVESRLIRFNDRNVIVDGTTTYLPLWGEYRSFFNIVDGSTFTFTGAYWDWSGIPLGSGPSSFTFYSALFSDLEHLPDLSNRQEVKYDYAACVILASFGLYCLFRSLWRSIRGRVD